MRLWRGVGMKTINFFKVSGRRQGVLSMAHLILLWINKLSANISVQ